MVESAATDEKQEERDRGRLKNRFVEFRKRKDEEDEARCFIEKRCNATLIPSRIKSCEAERKLCNALLECVEISTENEDARKLTIMWTRISRKSYPTNETNRL